MGRAEEVELELRRFGKSWSGFGPGDEGKSCRDWVVTALGRLEKKLCTEEQLLPEEGRGGGDREGDHGLISPLGEEVGLERRTGGLTVLSVQLFHCNRNQCIYFLQVLDRIIVFLGALGVVHTASIVSQLPSWPRTPALHRTSFITNPTFFITTTSFI